MDISAKPDSMEKPFLIVVDDSAVNLRLLDLALKADYLVTTAETGVQALKMIEESDRLPDMILLDIMMPEMDGYQVIEILKGNPRTWDIPIIFLTALMDSNYQTKGLSMGAVDFITKPFNVSVVKARIRFHLEKTRLERLIREKNQALEASNKALEAMVAELKETRTELAQKAHQEGRAEMATSVLHNIGNAVNSINVRISMQFPFISRSELNALDQILNLMKKDELLFSETSKETGKRQKLIDYFEGTILGLKTHAAKSEEDLQFIKSGIQHVVDIIGMQQEYAKVKTMNSDEDLNAIITDSLQMMRDSIRQRRIEVVTAFEPLPPVSVVKSIMMQVFINILKNAYESFNPAAEGDKKITIKTCSIRNGDASIAQIEIRDTGEGIPADYVDKVFQFGFTTKNQGSGFGLHNCANYINACGGSIKVSSDGVGKGTTVIIRFPQSRLTN